MNELREEVELPAIVEYFKRSEEERVAATERVCIGGKEAGIAFFTRHPHLGFSCAVHLQCELSEREEQLKSSLAANREQKAEIERLTEDNSKLHRRNCWLETGIACAKSDRLGMKAKLDAFNSGGFADADAMAGKYLDVVNELASLRASVGEKWIAYSESKPAYGETVEVLFSGPEIALCHREQEELADDDMREPVDILWDENGDQERSVMGIFWRKFAPPTLPGEEK